MNLRLGVIDVYEIDSAKQKFTANLTLEADWYDPQLAHDGSGEVAHKLESVWHPRLQLVNQQVATKTLPEIVEVSPSGRVAYRQRYWGAFSQRLDLREFPFDRQEFRIRVAAALFSTDEVEFSRSADQTKVVSELSVADWAIGNWNQQVENLPAVGSVDMVPGYELTFQARREIGYYVLKIILPLVLIVAMSWTVFWVSPELAGTQISIATTSMLTLIAYRFMVGNMLPNVSYLTRMDYFILGSMILVFVTLVQAVTTAFLANGDRIELAKRLDHWCRGIFPTGFIVVCLIAFFL